MVIVTLARTVRTAHDVRAIARSPFRVAQVSFVFQTRARRTAVTARSSVGADLQVRA
jgi:hypothetical protein